MLCLTVSVIFLTSSSLVDDGVNSSALAKPQACNLSITRGDRKNTSTGTHRSCASDVSRSPRACLWNEPAEVGYELNACWTIPLPRHRFCRARSDLWEADS